MDGGVSYILCLAIILQISMKWMSQLPYILEHNEATSSKNCILFYWQQIQSLLPFHVHFFFLYLMRIIAAVVGDIGRNILSYEGYKWILVFAAAQSASFPIMNALLRNTYRGSLSFCMVEDCWTTFFCRACRKRQGTLGQVFPIAMSQILYQWHVS